MRNQIWASLCNYKFKGYCIALLVQKLQKRDRSVNIFLALASSGSIAAWTIWNQYPIVWSAIICSSQVFTAIKPYVPYYKYVKELNAKCLRLDVINIEFEKLWYKIQYKKLDDDQAAELYFDYKKLATEILTFNDDTIFTVTKKIETLANYKMKIFLKSTYDTDISLNTFTN